jgi:hypothetical protein
MVIAIAIDTDNGIQNDGIIALFALFIIIS